MSDWQRTGKRTLRHQSGDWQIAKYASEPTYCLFDLRSGCGEMVKCSNDQDELKKLTERMTHARIGFAREWFGKDDNIES